MAQKNRQEQAREYAKFLGKVWADPDLKKRLTADPAAVLKENGFDVPEGKTIKVVEDTADTVFLHIPYRTSEISDEELDKISGGETSSSFCCKNYPDPPT